jgi:hypothetical protein
MIIHPVIQETIYLQNNKIKLMYDIYIYFNLKLLIKSLNNHRNGIIESDSNIIDEEARIKN